MVTITSLWLPILLAAVAVFIASSIIHMVLPYHRSDYKKLPDEGKVLEALGAAGVAPGDYAFPFADTPKEMGSPDMLEKYKKGPVGTMIVIPNGPPAMMKQLALWFVYCVVVGIFAAYLSGRTLGPGADYLAVFRMAGTTAFLSYGAAQTTDSIWKGQAWSTTFKHIFDSLVYGSLTAGVFGWLWP